MYWDGTYFFLIVVFACNVLVFHIDPRLQYL